MFYALILKNRLTHSVICVIILVIYKEVKEMSTFTDRLSLLLEKNNMTQRELSERIGVTTATLSRYVSGSRLPNSDTIANIAMALHTTSDYLLGCETDEQFDFPKIERIIARNASKMTIQEKKELINALFGE